MSGKPGYSAASDPPAGVRPARDTGVSAMTPCAIAVLTRERDDARWKRDEARRDLAACGRDCQRLNERTEALVEERDEARQQRDEARDAAEIMNETLEMMDRAFRQLQGERDAAQAALAEAVRSQELAEAEEAVMFGKAAALQRERDEARAAARDYLPHVKFSYDDHNRGKQYEQAERERLPWLGPPETPLEEC